ncbi:MAG: sodium-dependent transporter, partial [Clostridia bacterium]|nr:sodium-dependent transporter [Clostridia bacterium]
GQQLLDVVDYISNSFLMPLISLLTCLLIGWVVKPRWIVEEMEGSGHIFKRKKLYAFMIRYAAPILMTVLFLQSTGILRLN